MSTVISVENLSKSYQLGAINTGRFRQAQPDALSRDLNRWWACPRRGRRAKLSNLPDFYLKIGEKDHGNRQG